MEAIPFRLKEIENMSGADDKDIGITLSFVTVFCKKPGLLCAFFWGNALNLTLLQMLRLIATVTSLGEAVLPSFPLIVEAFELP